MHAKKKLKMQKNANEKCKSTPNIKSLTKKMQIGHANLSQKKCKNHSLSISQSLPNKFS
jgi:hypothetical protein